jgi:hypothetical protein
VDPEVVEDEKDLVLALPHKPCEEADQDLRVERAGEESTRQP